MEAALRPQLFCVLECLASAQALTLFNAGDPAAFDVDLLFLAVLDAEKLPLAEFAEAFAEPEHRAKVVKIGERLVDGVAYCVYNHLVYPVFPPHQQVKVRFSHPVVSDDYYLLLQFRDARGVNYTQTYWFMRGDGSRYALGGIDPEILMKSPRLDYDVIANVPKLRVKHRQQLPPGLLRDFEPMFAASLSAGYAPAFDLGVEDVGEWTKL
jgi:hypothetical protein